MVALGDVLSRVHEVATPAPEVAYHEVTVRLWGKGLVSRGIVYGSEVTSPRRYVRAGQLLMSKIDARNGALGIVPPELDGALVSNDFPTYAANETKLLPSFLGWLVRSSRFVSLCQAASEGTTNRIRLREDRLLDGLMPLPPLAEQKRVSTKLGELAKMSDQTSEQWQSIERAADDLLAHEFADLIATAPRRTLGEVAPLIRRPVNLQPGERYAEVGARSFGKGLFTKPDFDAGAATWQKPVWIKAGDLVLSNIKAWEGAIAVAEDQHEGCIASHRYLTCVPDPAAASAAFLCYFLLSPQGLGAVGLASPGTADRNRTTNPKGLQAIPVPLPPLSKQKAFTDLQTKVSGLRTAQSKQREQLDQLRQRALEEAFG